MVKETTKKGYTEVGAPAAPAPTAKPPKAAVAKEGALEREAPRPAAAADDGFLDAAHGARRRGVPVTFFAFGRGRSRAMLRSMSEVRPPAVGEIAPDFTLPDASRTPDAACRLVELCEARPLVLVFYRGHW
jgi:hypothetical protein